MPKINGKFGLSYKEVRAARERWRKIVNDCEWETFDDYLLWMVGTGWEKGMHIGKLDKTKPHGPKNSIWLTADRASQEEAANAVPDVGNPFCDKCQKKGTEECAKDRCKDWGRYFVRNWDKNIHRPTKQEGNKRETFVYSHPDDIREGRV